MIILPERGVQRTKLLLPVHEREWRQPSQRRSTFGIENQTRFRLTAKLNDGHIVWRGWFDDRDDADAFLFSMASGTLQYEPDLWRLPTPAWSPDFGEDVQYDFTTLRSLTGTSGSNQTDTIPTDWDSASANSIEIIAAGGTAGTSSGGYGSTGGSGAAYAKGTNLTLTPGGSATYRLTAGNGGDAWYNDTALPSAGSNKVGAKGGVTGNGGVTPLGVAGGLATLCWGGVGGSSLNPGASFSSSGGASASNPTANAAGGGGGAGGQQGTGGAGAAPSGNTGGGGGGNGGGGDASGATGGTSNGTDTGGVGGTGGASGAVNAGTAGGNGSLAAWGSKGSGAGGGGGSSSGGVGGSGGAAGSYGAGGGGNGASTGGTAGVGGQAIIVMIYTPLIYYPAKRRIINYIERRN